MRKVEAAIAIHQQAPTVFDAFTEQSMLKEWWGVERSLIEKKQGGLYSLGWGISNQGFQYVSTGIITVYIPERELMVDNFVYFNPDKPILGPTWLRIKLQKDNDYTILNLTQGGYQEEGEEWNWFYESVKDAWPKVLKNLKKYLET